MELVLLMFKKEWHSERASLTRANHVCEARGCRKHQQLISTDSSAVLWLCDKHEMFGIWAICCGGAWLDEAGSASSKRNWDTCHTHGKSTCVCVGCYSHTSDITSLSAVVVRQPSEPEVSQTLAEFFSPVSTSSRKPSPCPEASPGCISLAGDAPTELNPIFMMARLPFTRNGYIG